MSEPKDTPPSVGTSSLGGAGAIMERFKAFEKGESGESKTEAKVEESKSTQDPENRTETKQEASSEKKGDSILPPEKGSQKAPESKVEAKGSPDKGVQSTEAKRGSDGLTKEERAEVVKFKARAEELEAKLADHEATTKELTELRKIRVDLETKYKEVEERANLYYAKAVEHDVKVDPEFRRVVIEPMETLSKGMESLCEKNKLDVDAVFAAISNPDEVAGNAALSDIRSGLDEFTADKFKRIVNDLRDTERKGQDMLRDAPKTLTALQTKAKEEAERKSVADKETYEKASKALIPAWQERFPFIDKAMGEEILKEGMEVDFDKLTPASKATFAQALAVSTRFNSILKAKDDEIAALKAAVKKDTPPNVRDGQSENGSTAKHSDDEAYSRLSSGERYALAFGKRQ